jgi:hypothetical protein
MHSQAAFSAFWSGNTTILQTASCSPRHPSKLESAGWRYNCQASASRALLLGPPGAGPAGHTAEISSSTARLPMIFHRGPVRTVGAPDSAALFEVLFERDGWKSSRRDGIFDYAHYHSQIHEVLAGIKDPGSCSLVDCSRGSRSRTPGSPRPPSICGGSPGISGAGLLAGFGVGSVDGCRGSKVGSPSGSCIGLLGGSRSGGAIGAWSGFVGLPAVADMSTFPLLELALPTPTLPLVL